MADTNNLHLAVVNILLVKRSPGHGEESPQYELQLWLVYVTTEVPVKHSEYPVQLHLRAGHLTAGVDGLQLVKLKEVEQPVTT